MKISDLSVGDTLAFGQFRRKGRRAPDDLTWKKASEQNEFYLVSNTVGRFCADAREPQNESRDRRERGSNFFPQSNICQFLNADEENSWFRPQHDTDTVDDTLKDQPGFLSLFAEWERRLIFPHEITVAVPAGFKRKYGEKFKTTLKVSMLSRSQIFGGEDLTEGEQLPVFANGGDRPSDLLTRSALNSGFCAIDYRGRLVNSCPASERNIVPFLKLDGDGVVELDTYYGRYFLLPPEEVLKEITDELHQLLS